MKYSLLLSAIFILLVASSCHQGKDKGVLLKKSEEPISVLSLKYARGFSIHYFDGFKIISVRDGKDTTKLLAEYILYPKSSSAPLGYDKAVKIGTPVDKVVCISTTHIAELVKLNLVDRIAGITGASLIYNQEVHQRIEQGAIANLGNDEMDFERLVEIAPSFVLSSGSYDGGDKLNIKLRSLNIPSVLNLDYMEQDPLARAEWLKFMAAFFDREKEADSLFSITEEKYLSLKNQMKQVVQRPTVFCNIPFKEIWYMPCGENYMARLIEDAGGDFLWKNTNANNGLNLNLDYEAVYNKAAEADFWINSGFAKSLADIKAADSKNTFFKAWKTNKVFNNNLRNTPAGGFDFWESGTVNPDLILSDLITIFHPDFIPAHQLYYYQQLK